MKAPDLAAGLFFVLFRNASLLSLLGDEPLPAPPSKYSLAVGLTTTSPNEPVEVAEPLIFPLGLRTEPLIIVLAVLPKVEFHTPLVTVPVVTKLESPGYPVVLVKTPDAGVPNAGVTNV